MTLADTRLSVAATDWAAAESLLAIGIVPIGVPDTDVYRQWMRTIPLPESVHDLGSRAEPNLELLASLSPDQIFISNWQTNLVGQFEQIAPVYKVTIINPPTSPLSNARQALLDIAGLLSRADQADQCLATFDATMATATEKLGAMTNRDVIVGVLHENGRQLYAYGPGSWVDEIIVRIGLRNALGAPASRFGNALIDLTELIESPNAHLLYLDQGERTQRAEYALARSTVWRRIPMVKERRVHAIPVFYPLGGIPSAQRCIEVLLSALTNPVSYE